MNHRRDWRHYAVALLFLASTTATALLPRTSWPMILGTYAAAFGLYLLVIRTNGLHCGQWRFWLLTGLAARVALLFCFPNLSDDIYRFIWDGQMIVQGVNPYDVVPSAFLAGQANPVLSALYPLLNSPDYFTIYPPVGQGMFALSAWVSGGDWTFFSVALKLLFLLAECTTIGLLYLMVRSRALLIYVLNPLILIELMGNLHLDVLVITGLVMAIYFLRRQRLAGVAVGFVLGIGAKLIPAMLVPFLLRRLSIGRFLVLCLMLAGLCGVLFLPLWSGDVLQGAGSSVNLYFQKFEFNASLYYIARWIGYQIEGYNLIATIGPSMAGLTVVLLSGLLLLERNPSKENLPRTLMWALTIYFLCATTVHPWYVCTVLAMSVFTRYRFPVVWTAVAFLSYATYQTDVYSEDLVLVLIEYTVLFGMIIYELIRKRVAAQNDVNKKKALL